ncbi:MAG: hypothetical protein WBW48_05800 [Anaerolineae bacterium]
MARRETFALLLIDIGIPGLGGLDGFVEKRRAVGRIPRRSLKIKDRVIGVLNLSELRGLPSPRAIWS